MFEVNQKVAIKLKANADAPIPGTVTAVFPERPYPVLVLVDESVGINRDDEPAYSDLESGTLFDFSFTADGQLVDGADLGSIVAAE